MMQSSEKGRKAGQEICIWYSSNCFSHYILYLYTGGLSYWIPFLTVRLGGHQQERGRGGGDAEVFKHESHKSCMPYAFQKLLFSAVSGKPQEGKHPDRCKRAAPITPPLPLPIRRFLLEAERRGRGSGDVEGGGGGWG